MAEKVQTEREKRIAALRAAIEKQRATPDQPSCIEVQMWRDLDALMDEAEPVDGADGVGG